MGVARTIDFLMRKKIVSADEALELGLINQVVPGNKLKETARQLAMELANGPQVSMRLLKRSVYLSAELSFEQACEDIAARTSMSDHHPDSKRVLLHFGKNGHPLSMNGCGNMSERKVWTTRQVFSLFTPIDFAIISIRQ